MLPPARSFGQTVQAADPELEHKHADALCAMCDGSLAELSNAYETAAAHVHPSETTGWWHKANALWHASREYGRRHAGCDALSKRRRGKHAATSSRAMQMEYELEASSLLALRHAADAYRKTRPELDTEVMATTRKSKQPGSAPAEREANSTRATPAKRGIDARYPWKEEPNPYFELRTSEIQGTGAFATRNIRKGTRIIEYLGQRISWRTADKRYDDEKMGATTRSSSRWTTRTVIDAAVNGNDARFINHSCDRNCEAINDRKRIFIEARRNIQPGDGAAVRLPVRAHRRAHGGGREVLRCRCGSPKCRGTILAPVATEG